MLNKERMISIELRMECDAHSAALYLTCSDHRVKLRQLMTHPKYDCLIPPSKFLDEPGGQACTVLFSVSEYKRLVRRSDDLSSEDASVNLNEEVVRSFIRSVTSLVHEKYNRVYQSVTARQRHSQSSDPSDSPGQTKPTVPCYLGLVSADHIYLDSDGSLRMMSPLFYCDERLCWAIGLQHTCGTEEFHDHWSDLDPVEKELLTFGKLMYDHLLAVPSSYSTFSVSPSDLILAEFKHNGCSQQLEGLISNLSDVHLCLQFPESISVDSDVLLLYETESDEESIPTSSDTELGKFLHIAKSFCMNTLHAPDGPVADLLAFLINHNNVLNLINHLFQSLNSSDDVSYVINPPNGLPNSYANDLLETLCVLLRHDFDTFTLHEFLLTDRVLSRNLLLIPEKCSGVYAYAFCQIITTLLKTQPTSRSLLLAFVNQPELLSNIVSKIWHDDILTSLFNIIDILSKPDNAELHPLLVKCMEQIGMCSRLVTLAQQADCMTMLSATMQIYDQLLNSRVPELMVLAIDCLPMLLTVIDSSTLGIISEEEVPETTSLLTTGYFNCCGRVFSVGLSLMLKTSLQLSNKASPLTDQESILKETIESIYPRLRIGLCALIKRLSHFVAKMVSSYPADATNLHPPRSINYLYSCLVFCAHLFSTSADLKSYLYFKNNTTGGSNEFGLKNKTRSFPGNIVEPSLEVALPFSAKIGAGGPHQVLISQTYLSNEGQALLISLHCLIEAFLSRETRFEICKIFCVYPRSTMLHYAVSRIFIPCIELFITEVDKLEIILSKSAFVTVGQHLRSIYNSQEKRWSSGSVHFINLLKSLVRIAAGVSDQSIFSPGCNTVSERSNHTILRGWTSNEANFSIGKLASRNDLRSIPAVKYLLENSELVSLSEYFLDTECKAAATYTSSEKSVESVSEYTDSSDIAEVPTDTINLSIPGDTSDPILGFHTRNRTRHPRPSIVGGQRILIDCLIPLRTDVSQSSDE